MTDTINTDFNLDNEFVAEPLLMNATYRGNVTSVKHDAASSAIIWGITLEGNEGFTMSDGESPVDGKQVFFRNYLPKPGDENEKANNNMTKRQNKINMLKRFAEGMQIDMNTPIAISEAISNAEWVGIPVLVTVKTKEYQGQTSNEVGKMVRNNG